jgi:hypothetical protein
VAWGQYRTRYFEQAEREHWWSRHHELFPSTHGIGIVTGKLSGLAVLDIDDHEEASRLLTLHGHPGGPIVVTPRGHHWYYAYPPDWIIGNRHRGIYDLRAEGGYVLAPPSVSAPGVPAHRWIDPPNPRVALPALPGWVLELFEKAEAA